MGAEAQVGDAVNGRYVIVHNKAEKLRLYPHHYNELAESSIAYPIMRADKIAGCLLAISVLPDYFSPARVNLVRSYADLACLAFADDEFYHLRDVQLGLIPHPDIQKPHLEDFQQRVWQYMRQANQRNELLRKPEAELLVWQEIEERLLQL
jgi:hypothetical protein